MTACQETQEEMSFQNQKRSPVPATPPSKPKVAPNTNLNKRQPLSNKKYHKAIKVTATTTTVPNHKFNTCNCIYSAPLNLSNFLAHSAIDPNTVALLEYHHLLVVPEK